MPDDSLPPFPALAAQLKQLQQLRAAVDQAQLARLLCTSQQRLQCLPDPVSLQVMMQVMQTGVAMLHHLDRQLAWLSPGGASPARGATAPAAPHAHEIRPGTSIAPKGDVVDTNTNASAVRKAMHRGINCTVCKGSVPAPRYRYCSDDCEANGLRKRRAKNSREYRKRKKKEKQEQHEATLARIKHRSAS
jgi:hypothetical protein